MAPRREQELVYTHLVHSEFFGVFWLFLAPIFNKRKYGTTLRIFFRIFYFVKTQSRDFLALIQVVGVHHVPGYMLCFADTYIPGTCHQAVRDTERERALRRTCAQICVFPSDADPFFASGVRI